MLATCRYVCGVGIRCGGTFRYDGQGCMQKFFQGVQIWDTDKRGAYVRCHTLHLLGGGGGGGGANAPPLNTALMVLETCRYVV